MFLFDLKVLVLPVPLLLGMGGGLGAAPILERSSTFKRERELKAFSNPPIPGTGGGAGLSIVERSFKFKRRDRELMAFSIPLVPGTGGGAGLIPIGGGGGFGADGPSGVFPRNVPPFGGNPLFFGGIPFVLFEEGAAFFFGGNPPLFFRGFFLFGGDTFVFGERYSSETSCI